MGAGQEGPSPWVQGSRLGVGSSRRTCHRLTALHTTPTRGAPARTYAESEPGGWVRAWVRDMGQDQDHDNMLHAELDLDVGIGRAYGFMATAGV
jgi:hypothetical protein